VYLVSTNFVGTPQTTASCVRMTGIEVVHTRDCGPARGNVRNVIPLYVLLIVQVACDVLPSRNSLIAHEEFDASNASCAARRQHSRA